VEESPGIDGKSLTFADRGGTQKEQKEIETTTGSTELHKEDL
jgi:hypothetical protein